MNKSTISVAVVVNGVCVCCWYLDSDRTTTSNKFLLCVRRIPAQATGASQEHNNSDSNKSSEQEDDSNDAVEVEVVGRIASSYSFHGLADFHHYVPPVRAIAKSTAAAGTPTPASTTTASQDEQQQHQPQQEPQQLQSQKERLVRAYLAKRKRDTLEDINIDDDNNNNSNSNSNEALPRSVPPIVVSAEEPLATLPPLFFALDRPQEYFFRPLYSAPQPASNVVGTRTVIEHRKPKDEQLAALLEVCPCGFACLPASLAAWETHLNLLGWTQCSNSSSIDHAGTSFHYKQNWYVRPACTFLFSRQQEYVLHLVSQPSSSFPASACDRPTPCRTFPPKCFCGEVISSGMPRSTCMAHGRKHGYDMAMSCNAP